MINWEKYMLTEEKADKTSKQAIVMAIFSILVSIAGIIYNIHSVKKVEKEFADEEDNGVEDDLPF